MLHCQEKKHDLQRFKAQTFEPGSASNRCARIHGRTPLVGLDEFYFSKGISEKVFKKPTPRSSRNGWKPPYVKQLPADVSVALTLFFLRDT
jgi:hypothetical protein